MKKLILLIFFTLSISANLNNNIANTEKGLMCPTIDIKPSEQVCGTSDIFNITTFKSYNFAGANGGGFFCPTLAGSAENSGNGEADLVKRIDLSGVNLATGEYSCNYYIKDKLALSCKYTNFACKTDINRATNANLKDLNSIRFSHADLGEDLFLTGADINLQNQLNQLANIKKSDLTLQLNKSFEKLDSSIKQYMYGTINPLSQRYTLSSLFRAIVTIDRDIIQGTNSHGEILFTANQKFQDDLSEVITDEGFFGDGNTGFFGTLKSIIKEANKALYSGNQFTGIDKNINNQANANQNAEDFIKNSELVSLTDIFDKKFFGWMANFNLAIDNLATSMLYWFGSFVLVGFIGQQIGLKSIEVLTKKWGGELNTNYKNMMVNPWIKIMSITLIFGTFMLPFAKSMQTNLSDIQIGSTTIAKSILTTTSEIGEKFATTLNDIGSALFIKFQADNQNISGEKDIERGVRELYTNFVLAKKSLAFRDLCWEQYEGYKNQGTFLNADESWLMGGNCYFGAGAESFIKRYFLTNWQQLNMGTYRYTDDSRKYGTFAISPYLCRNVETRAITLVNRVVADDINLDNKIATVQEGKKVQAMELLINNSFINSDKIGWVNVVLKPIEYLFLKYADVLTVLSQDPNNIKNIGQKYSNTTKSNNGGGDDNKIDSAWFGQATDNASWLVSKGITYTVSMYIYNILPGFSTIQQNINMVFRKSYELTVKEGDDNFLDTIKSFTSNVTSNLPILGGIGGSVASSNVGKYLLSLMDSKIVEHFAVLTIMFIISFLITIKIYSFLIQVFFATTITIMAVGVVLFYHITLFKYIFFSPFIALYAFATGGYQSFMGFIKNAGITTILKPSIIVLSMYLFIFSNELLITMYQFTVSWLINNLNITFSIANVADMNNQFFNTGISSYLFINTLETMLEILITLVSLFMGYFFMVNSTNWVFRIMQHRGDDGISEEAGKQNPIKR